jgi:hypothetical protein
MENNIAQKVIAFATILALPFALGAFVLAWAGSYLPSTRNSEVCMAVALMLIENIYSTPYNLKITNNSN